MQHVCTQLTEDDELNQGTQGSTKTMDNQEHEENSSFDSLIEDMKNKLRTPATPPASEDLLLISWVDEQLRDVDPGGYTPRRVLVGPLHREPSHWMEQEKKNRLYSALPSTDEQQCEQALRQYLEAMADVEVRARRCYNDSTLSTMKSEAFACMLLLDGYFVLSCLELAGSTTGGARGKATQESRSEASDLYDRDIIFLVENQVPFFVLEDIHRLLFNNNSVVVEGIAKHIETWVVHHHLYVHSTVTYSTVMANLKGKPPCHLLHLLYVYFWPTAIDHRRRSGSAQMNGYLTAAHVELTVAANSPVINNAITSGSTKGKATVVPQSRWRSATYYYAAGVRLAKRELDGKEARSILDVEVKDGTLHVPCLRIDGNTLTILRNMVALEQHYPGIGSHVAAYCHFLSQVASTEEDVKLLSNEGIIVHCLSKDSAVADGFANLCRGVILNMSNPDFYYLKRLQEDLEKLCQSHWRKSMAWLRHNKCNNILMALAVVAAVILFVCTVEQSFFAALSYFTGKS